MSEKLMEWKISLADLSRYGISRYDSLTDDAKCIHVVEVSALDSLREKYTKLMHVNEDLLGQNEQLRDALQQISDVVATTTCDVSYEIARQALETKS